MTDLELVRAILDVCGVGYFEYAAGAGRQLAPGAGQEVGRWSIALDWAGRVTGYYARGGAWL